MGWFTLKPYDIVGKIKYIHLKVFMDIKKEYIARTDLSCLVIEPYSIQRQKIILIRANLEYFMEERWFEMNLNEWIAFWYRYGEVQILGRRNNTEFLQKGIEAWELKVCSKDRFHFSWSEWLHWRIVQN